MGIIDEARAQHHGNTGTCGFETWMATQAADDRAEWQIALRDRSFTTSSLFRVAKARGFRLGLGAISQHRRDHLK